MNSKTTKSQNFQNKEKLKIRLKYFGRNNYLTSNSLSKASVLEALVL